MGKPKKARQVPRPTGSRLANGVQVLASRYRSEASRVTLNDLGATDRPDCHSSGLCDFNNDLRAALRTPPDIPCHEHHRASRLTQRPHDLEGLDPRIGPFQSLEPSDRFDQLLQFAVVGLDDIVQVFDPADAPIHQSLCLSL